MGGQLDDELGVEGDTRILGYVVDEDGHLGRFGQGQVVGPERFPGHPGLEIARGADQGGGDAELGGPVGKGDRELGRFPGRPDEDLFARASGRDDGFDEPQRLPIRQGDALAGRAENEVTREVRLIVFFDIAPELVRCDLVPGEGGGQGGVDAFEGFAQLLSPLRISWTALSISRSSASPSPK